VLENRTTVDGKGESSDGANCKGSDFILGLYFGLLVVALKGVVSIDPLVIAVGPDQLNYETQPQVAMILRREGRVGSLQVLSLESRPLTQLPAGESEPVLLPGENPWKRRMLARCNE
jgi:hypothetical protein